MSFKGLNNKLATLLIDWGLSPPIIRAFLAELERIFSDLDPSDVPASRRLGMNKNVIIPDPNDPKKRYVFFVRFARNDDDYWISDINCAGVTTENKLFWTPFLTPQGAPGIIARAQQNNKEAAIHKCGRGFFFARKTARVLVGAAAL